MARALGSKGKTEFLRNHAQLEEIDRHQSGRYLKEKGLSKYDIVLHVNLWDGYLKKNI